MIKVIAFDFGGVIGSDADEWSTTFKKVLEYSGLTESEMLQVWEKHWPQLKIGKESIENYWIDTAAKKRVSPEKLREIYNESIIAKKEVLNLAKSLKKKYKIVILSNDAKDWMEAKTKRFELNKIFEKIYLSADLGIAKPQKEIFEYVLRGQKINPQELLFIDNQENNYEAAISLGIKPILFKNLKQLKKELSFLPTN